MENQRRRMIWFEITKRRLLSEQNQEKDQSAIPEKEIPESIGKWEDEDDYVSQR